MRKTTLYSLAATWFALLIMSLWFHWWVIDIVAAFVSICFGVWVVRTDPRTSESKRIGYRVIGLVFLAFGIFELAFSLHMRSL